MRNYIQNGGGDATVSHAILGGALIVLVLLTSFLSYWQERQAADVLKAIRAFMPSECEVVRGGRTLCVPASELVVGDVVHLTVGNLVPADVRGVPSADLTVEMASLTR